MSAEFDAKREMTIAKQLEATADAFEAARQPIDDMLFEPPFDSFVDDWWFDSYDASIEVQLKQDADVETARKQLQPLVTKWGFSNLFFSRTTPDGGFVPLSAKTGKPLREVPVQAAPVGKPS